MAVETFQFDSTNVDNGEYDPETRTMNVTFLRTGQVYISNNITPQEWEAFKAAASPGNFYRTNFRDRF